MLFFFGWGFYSSYSYSEETGFFFFVAKGFWTGDLAFWTGDLAFKTGDLTLVGFLTYSSDYYSEEDYTFLAGFLATGFWTGEVTFATTFVGLALTTGSDYSSDED